MAAGIGGQAAPLLPEVLASEWLYFPESSCRRSCYFLCYGSAMGRGRL